jgi:hypothetical protein
VAVQIGVEDGHVLILGRLHGFNLQL